MASKRRRREKKDGMRTAEKDGEERRYAVKPATRGTNRSRCSPRAIVPNSPPNSDNSDSSEKADLFLEMNPYSTRSEARRVRYLVVPRTPTISGVSENWHSKILRSCRVILKFAPETIGVDGDAVSEYR